jgi:hypothetical protein
MKYIFILFLILITCEYSEENYLPKMPYVFTAEVSEKFNIPDDIRYCGMPNLETFAIKPAWYRASNLYYPINIDTIKIDCMAYTYIFQVLTVTPWNITLRYVPKENEL